MTETADRTLNTWLRSAQTGVAIMALIGALIYAGQRSERDEAQTRALEKVASEMAKIQEQAVEGNAQIRVINVRISGLEDRVSRIERK